MKYEKIQCIYQENNRNKLLYILRTFIDDQLLNGTFLTYSSCLIHLTIPTAPCSKTCMISFWTKATLRSNDIVATFNNICTSLNAKRKLQAVYKNQNAAQHFLLDSENHNEPNFTVGFNRRNVYKCNVAISII